MNSQEFLERISAGKATIGVVGLGYVGLPLVLTFHRKGFGIVGFDVDLDKVAKLSKGESYIRHIPSSEIVTINESGRFSATTDFSRIKECDSILICVPTPLNKNREPDMQYVEGTAEAIGPHLKSGQLVALESTTYPGTTEELLRPILERASGLTAGKDFFLAYSPEREDPGNPDFNTQRIPKLVGGLTPACKEVAVALYKVALDEVVPVSSLRVAEMTKLFENIFRCVNIALVNETKLLCDRMDIDVWEVVTAAATKPFGFMPFYPGPGLGGHCIPIDPFYLTWKAREYELSTRFIELAGEVNSRMPLYVVERTMHALNEHRKPLNGAKLLIVGVAYKKDVGDVRESPALSIIEMLQKHGAEVQYHDPFVPRLARMRHHDLEMESVPLDEKTIRGMDAVIITTDHTDIDYKSLVEAASLVVDTRNATRHVACSASKVIKA